MRGEYHDTTITSGRDEFGGWAEWVCTCGAGDDGLATRSEAVKAAKAHRDDNR